MSRQRYKINQLVFANISTRYYSIAGIGVVSDYTSKQYAPYRVRVICVSHSNESYYYGNSAFTKDCIFSCTPSELSPVLTLSNSNTHISTMKSMISNEIQQTSGSLQRIKIYGNITSSECYYRKEYEKQLAKLLWLSFANKRMKNLQVLGLASNKYELSVDPQHFIKFPLEQERRRDEYVH